MDAETRRAVIVTGSRDWVDGIFLRERLEDAAKGADVFVVIEGGAAGADGLAGTWANSSADHERYPADWRRHGKGAGPIRNAEMLKRLLELEASGYEVWVMAFKEGFDRSLRRGGTENMVRQARVAGVKVVLYGDRVEGNGRTVDYL